MRILQLCPRFPYPLTDGGRIGIFNITRALAGRGHEVTMLAFASDDTDDAAIAAVARVARVHVVRDDTRTGMRHFLRGLVRLEPVYMARHRSRRFTRALDAILRAETFDAVYADHTGMAPYALHARRRTGMPAGLRLHNIESLIWQRYAKALGDPARRLVIGNQARMLARTEAKAIAAMDVNFAITDIDRERALRMAPGADVRVVMPGIDHEYWQPPAQRGAAHTAITVTALAWVHNVDGILWFLDEVVPRIRTRIPDFVLHVVGKDPPPRLARRAGDTLVLHGFLDDVRPAMAQSPVYVVPLHVGGGIRIKIIEAMATGLPVVTTSVGCEGIPARAGEELVVGDTAEAFADGVIALLTDSAAARAMGERGRDFAVRSFSWDRAAACIASAFDEVRERRTQHG